ncbi:DUF4030 domain-containing protein [Cytobacillus kochii]|uniref:DUF4030 domain-containing protein n=1 Tax=Cytobacillus kochii TaxID=859143 RepID=UPI002040DF05|nr:DUF4030 domain-containing protein [Cytobacillus kochii]MCM3324812.1 DUF4030 domain-containing protein [Cytobacillus kochii]MCM3347205.1 DUF4030 domain-containing protein [Cytobacillus kochii]
MKKPPFNKIKEEIDNIPLPEKKLDMIVNNALKSKQKKIFPLKKITLFAATAIFLLGVFLSTSLISPTLANVVSKIPLIGDYIAQEPLNKKINNLLEEKGFSVESISTVERYINIAVDDSVSNEIKKDINAIVEKYLVSKGYDNYAVAINTVDNSHLVETTQDKAFAIEEEEITSILNDFFAEKEGKENIAFDVIVNEHQNIINIELPKSLDGASVDFKQEVETFLSQLGKEGYTIVFNSVDYQKVNSDQKWAMITKLVSEEIYKDNKTITGVGYSVSGKKPELYIHTTIDGSKTQITQSGKEIEDKVRKVLNGKELKSIIGNNEFILTVENKNGEKIN